MTLVRRRLTLGLALGLALVVLTPACGRTPVEQAAVRAQEACIAVLEPVSEDGHPSPADVRSALADAEAAARVDQRWALLRERIRELASSASGGGPLDGLAQECDRVNQIVKEKRDDV